MEDQIVNIVIPEIVTTSAIVLMTFSMSNFCSIVVSKMPYNGLALGAVADFGE
jgi:hypothetical protein